MTESPKSIWYMAGHHAYQGNPFNGRDISVWTKVTQVVMPSLEPSYWHGGRNNWQECKIYLWLLILSHFCLPICWCNFQILWYNSYLYTTLILILRLHPDIKPPSVDGTQSVSVCLLPLASLVISGMSNRNKRTRAPPHLSSTVTHPTKTCADPLPSIDPSIPSYVILPSIHLSDSGGTQRGRQTWAAIRFSLLLRGPLSELSKGPVGTWSAAPIQS